MIKFFLFFIALLCFPFVLSQKSCNGDICVQSFVSPQASNDNFHSNLYPFNSHITKTYYANYEEPIQEQQDSGGGYRKKFTPLYGFLLETTKNLYSKGQYAEARIVIVNEGDLPDKDTILITYIESPNGRRYGEKRQYFKEIDISCNIGKYDLNSQMCKFEDKYYKADVLEIKEKIKIDDTFLTGDWKYYGVYYTTAQPTIQVYDSFIVRDKPDYSGLYLFMLVLISLCFSVILIAFIKRRKKKK